MTPLISLLWVVCNSCLQMFIRAVVWSVACASNGILEQFIKHFLPQQQSWEGLAAVVKGNNNIMYAKLLYNRAYEMLVIYVLLHSNDATFLRYNIPGNKGETSPQKLVFTQRCSWMQWLHYAYWIYICPFTMYINDLDKIKVPWSVDVMKLSERKVLKSI